MSLNEQVALSRAIELFDNFEIPNFSRPQIAFRRLEAGIGGICREHGNVIEIDIWQLSDIGHFDGILLHEFAHSLLPREVFHSWPFLAVSALLVDTYMLLRGVDDFDYFKEQVFLDMQWWWAAPASMRREHINKAKSYVDRLKNGSVIDGVNEIKRDIPLFHFYSLFTNRRPATMLLRIGAGGLLSWWFVIEGNWRGYTWIFN